MAAPSNKTTSLSSRSSSGEEEHPFPHEPKWQDNHSSNLSGKASPPQTNYGRSQTGESPPPNSAPIQKRRRVTRACDECRRKKIKCDGKQPCTHCTVYSYECTYDQPSNRRRNPAPQYIEALETRVHRMEALIKIVLPGVDVNSPDFDFDKLPHVQKPAPGNNNGDKDFKSGIVHDDGTLPSQDAMLETMVEAAGRLDIDECGHFDFHGHSSGFTFLNKLREQFGDLLGGPSNNLLRFNPPGSLGTNGIASGPLNHLNSPSSVVNSPRDVNGLETAVLPMKNRAEVLVNKCLNEACILMRFIHQPTFDAMFERIYRKEANGEEYDNEEYRFLPLLYFVLAVGCVFANEPHALGFTNGTTEGIKYFQQGRKMIEVTDCRDCTSIQCVILMILFLQSSAKMSTCYSYVGIALSASLRMGLHRNIPVPDLVESEVRKRIFWTVRKMGIYVGTLLGLPKGIQDEDIDQDYPTELDDQFITKDGFLRTPGELPSSIAAANAHTKLLKILDKLVRKIYPIKGMQISKNGRRAGYIVNYTTVREIEEDLEQWKKELPMYLRPGDDAPIRFVRSQSLLRMSFAHVKMMLYRPFIHYIARPKDTLARDDRPYASAAECINISREIVHICVEMKQKNILNGAYWFNIYTTFFSVISLVYFVLENIQHPDAPAILRDATMGKDCLISIKDCSLAAERCCLSLKSLFDQLPAKLEIGYRSMSKEATQQRKRNRGASPVRDGRDTDSPLTVSTLATDHPSSNDKEYVDFKMPSRSRTFPSTPDSMDIRPPIDEIKSNTAQSFQNNPLSFQQHLGGARGMPDLNALMFPASSAFAYGNQALKLENSPQFTSDMPTNLLQSPNFTYSSPDSSTSHNRNSPFILNRPSVDMSTDQPLDMLEAQLYGPLPPYLYQGQPSTNSFNSDDVMQFANNLDENSDSSNTLSNNGGLDRNMFPPSQDNGSMDIGNNFNVNFEELFSTGIEGTEWEEMLLQNTYRR